MGRRTVTDEERAERAARAVHFEAINTECERAKAAALAAGMNYCKPEWWLNRACRIELGAAPYALELVQLPAAVRVAKRLAFQVEQYAAALPPLRTPLTAGRKEYRARAAGLKDAMRCEVRRPPQTAPSPSLRPLRDVVAEFANSRCEARAGPVAQKSGPVQAPEKVNPTDRQVRGVRVEQSQTSEEKDMALNGSAAAPSPQPEESTPGQRIKGAPPPGNGIRDGKIEVSLQFGNVEGAGLLARLFVAEAREIFIDIQCDQARESATAVAILALSAAEEIISHLTQIARHAPEVTP